jgi:hypothetical protein
MQTIAKFENENQLKTVPEKAVKFDWKKVNFEEWETPQNELNKCPEYQHLEALCKELGLSL